MVEEMKGGCIRVQSSTNEWMDCIFLVSEEEKEKAIEVLKKAWDDFWEEGKGGCPDTVRELVEDAEAIVEMVKELYGQLDGVLHPELSDEQSERCDEIYNAVYEMCKVIAGDEELEWDMYYIGEIAELAANMMVNRGYKVRFPAIVTEEDGSQHIEEYYEPDQEGGESENE